MLSQDVKKTSKSKKRGFLFTLLILVVIIVAIVIIVPGTRAKARSLARMSINIVKATLNREEVTAYSQGDITNIIFLHQSTGRNLIEQGHVRELFTDLGYQFSDQGYNFEWLHDPNGTSTGYSYNVPKDQTDPDGMARIFRQRVYSLPVNTLSGLLQYEVIIFKSCFDPTSHIESDEELDAYKADYLQVRDTIDQHPDKLFILLTQPPLNPAETNAEEAARARNLADWLASAEYLGGRTNLFIYDFFDALAVNDPHAADNNMLRFEYRSGDDSHPNRTANEEIGPKLVEFVNQAIDAYRKSAGTEAY